MTETQRADLQDPNISDRKLYGWTDSRVAQEYDERNVTRVDTLKYAVYTYEIHSDEKIDAQPWVPITDVGRLRLPAGEMKTFFPYTEQNRAVMKIVSLLPFIDGETLAEAGKMINYGIQMLAFSVFSNENYVRLWDQEIQNDDDHFIIRSYTIHPAELSLQQRVFVGGLSVGLFVRGFLKMIYLDFLFAPIDILYCH